MSDDFVSVQFDQKSLDRVHKQLAKFDKKGVAEKLNRGTLAAMRLLVPSVQAASPVRTGTLRRSVKARKASRSGEIGAVLGPTAPHRHLVIQPHRIVTPGGRFTGRMTSGNSFVNAAAEPRLPAAMAEVQKALFTDG